MAANTALVKWAQRKDSLYLAIALPDIKDHQVELTDRKLVFQGTSGDKLYKLDLEFFKEISAEGSVWNVLPASVQMKLNKKEQEDEFWPRLLLDKNQEKTNVKIDWDKYVDEDEAEGNEFDMGALDGGMDFGGMGDMGGMAGMGGMGGMGVEAELTEDQELGPRPRAGSSDAKHKPLIKDLPRGVQFFSLMNKRNNFFIPSTKNVFGGVKVSELKCDSGCKSMLLPISDLSVLVAAFPPETHRFEVKSGNGTAGKTLSLVVSSMAAFAKFTIHIARDLIDAPGIMQSKIRFALCEDDKQSILQDTSRFNLRARSLLALNSTDISKQTRRSHGLLGQSVLSELASIKYLGCELYVDPATYQMPPSFSELETTVDSIKAQLAENLPPNFNDWEDDDYEYEDDERDEE